MTDTLISTLEVLTAVLGILSLFVSLSLFCLLEFKTSYMFLIVSCILLVLSGFCDLFQENKRQKHKEDLYQSCLEDNKKPYECDYLLKTN